MNERLSLTKKNSLKIFFLENLLLIFFVYDFLIKTIVYYTEIKLFFNYVIAFKALIVLIIVFQQGFRQINKIYLLPTIGLVICYVITEISNYKALGLDDIQFNGYYFLSSITPIAFIFFITNIDIKIIRVQINRLVFFLILSSGVALLGYLFEINVFRSYYRGERFGYSGFLLYHHEAGFIYFILINILYYKFKKCKSKINLFLFLFVLMTSFIVGTKKTLFLTLIFIGYLLIDNIKNIKTLLIISVLGVLNAIVFYDNLNKYYLLFSRIYKEDGFWSSFLSYRNTLFLENFYPYITYEGSIKNIIFGYPFFNNNRTEMEVFDLFLFFGLIGIFCYIIFFIRLLKKKNKLTYFIVISLITATLFSGNLLASVNVMLLLFFTIFYINSNKKFKGEII